VYVQIGIVLALSGNVLISVSLNTQKYAHNQNEARGAGKQSYLKLKLWWAGMTLMAVGEVGMGVSIGVVLCVKCV